MNCPRCVRPLRTVRVSSIDVNGCGACGGVWLDNRASAYVVSVLDRDVVRVADLAAQAASVPFPDESRAPACPTCGATLVRASPEGIALDVCAAHGTWFDRDELQEIAKRNFEKRKASAPKNTGAIGTAPTALNAGPRYAGFKQELADDALGVAAGVGFEVALNIVGTILSGGDD